MNRAEFMKELEYLLQDISPEEREDAVAYYRDYLEEAGEDHEEEAIREFGSPARVAAILRAELEGNLEDSGEFTETGYRNEKFREPGYQVAERLNLPEVTEEAAAFAEEDGKAVEEPGWEKAGSGWSGQDPAGQGQEASWHREAEPEGPGTKTSRKKDIFQRVRDVFTRGTAGNRILKLILIGLILCMAAPILVALSGLAAGFLSGVLAVAAAFLSVLVVLVLMVGLLTLAALLGAVVLLAIGVFTLFHHPGNGVLLIGCGVFLLGLGVLGVAASIMFYGKLIPYCLRGAVDWIGGMFRRKRKKVSGDGR